MKRLHSLFSIGMLSTCLLFTACGTSPRHEDYVVPQSNYQRIMAACIGKDHGVCQRRYEMMYGVVSDIDYMSKSVEIDHRLMEYHDIMAECEGGDLAPCQNRYDRMTVF